jgi:hypothetical protein
VLVVVVVDQPNTIGALPVAVARSRGIDVADLAMRRIAHQQTNRPRFPAAA